MRKDMAKVIVERPRLKSPWPSKQGRRRYLRKQVGSRWDEVYRDISAHLRVSSVVQQHVRDHVRWEVERVVEAGAKGRVWAFADMRWVGGRWRPMRRGELYVDPSSGVLKVVKRG